MLDVGFQELVLLACIGLLVLGPERLPAVVKTMGVWVRKARRMASDFQRELEKEVDMQEFNDLRKDFAEVAKPFDEVAQKAREIESGLRNPEQSLFEQQQIGVAPEAKHDAPDDLAEATSAQPSTSVSNNPTSSTSESSIENPNKIAQSQDGAQPDASSSGKAQIDNA